MTRHIEVGGLSIAFERTGAGPAVARRTASWDDRSTWGRQIETLADEFTVVAWDAPGAGGFRALQIARGQLVGLSLGASLVLAAFHRHRGLALSLTLVSGYADWLSSLGRDDADQRLARSLEHHG